MTADPAATEALRASTPFARTLGIEVLAVDGEHALLRLPAAEGIANHVGGPHAGAIFTLGESAAATLMLQRFGGWLDRAVPLAVAAQISWSKLALSAVTAHASADGVVERVEAELAEGRRPEWETTVVFRREEDGEECARMSVVLTLRPLRPNP
ncbi:MAG: PaaI family thioesterase [Actinomycetes bacterium]